jgi:hypothetical protein
VPTGNTKNKKPLQGESMLPNVLPAPRSETQMKQISHKPKRSDLLGSAVRDSSQHKKLPQNALAASSKSNLRNITDDIERDPETNAKNYLISISPKDKDG